MSRVIAFLLPALILLGCLGSDNSMSSQDSPDDEMATEQAPAQDAADDEDPVESPVGILIVTGEDAGNPVDAKFPEEFGSINSITSPRSPAEGDNIRITWTGRISHGGNLQYDEIHTDGSVTVRANGLVAGWLLQVSSKADLASAGVTLDRLERRLAFRNTQLIRIGGTSTIILNGTLEY